MSEKNKKDQRADNKERSKQQQSDPQITELKGFIDEDEKIEPEIKGDPEHDDERAD